jgi:hypothetical protein
MRQYYSAMGVGVHVHHDMMRFEFVISAVSTKNGTHINKRISDNQDEAVILACLKQTVDELLQHEKKPEVDAAINDAMRVLELERELARYKEAVKKLSFDLEMSRTPSKAVATEADVRKATLEMAAEFLMDYGVIRTGPELQSVCEQMKKLHPSRAMVMAEAAKKMAAGWTQYDPR